MPGGDIALFGVEDSGELLVTRLGPNVDIDVTCAFSDELVPDLIAIWLNGIELLVDITVTPTTESFRPGVLSTVDVPGARADVCFTSGACSASMATVAGLLAVRNGGDVDLTWREDQAANGYNLWTVINKEEIDLARQSSSPPATAINGCATPTPSAGPGCTDFGAVARNDRLFYQVRSHCDPTTEGR